jgi:hypothetical protein
MKFAWRKKVYMHQAIIKGLPKRHEKLEILIDHIKFNNEILRLPTIKKDQ